MGRESWKGVLRGAWWVGSGLFPEVLVLGTKKWGGSSTEAGGDPSSGCLAKVRFHGLEMRGIDNRDGLFYGLGNAEVSMSQDDVGR